MFTRTRCHRNLHLVLIDGWMDGRCAREKAIEHQRVFGTKASGACAPVTRVAFD